MKIPVIILNLTLSIFFLSCFGENQTILSDDNLIPCLDSGKNLKLKSLNLSSALCIPGNIFLFDYEIENTLENDVLQTCTGIYLSTDDELDNEDMFLGEDNTGSIPALGSIIRQNISATLPSYLPANTEYYIHLYTDYKNNICETVEDDNIAGESVITNYLGYYSLEKSFEWYKSMMGTGDAQYNNCAPACVSMAIKYYMGEDVSVSDIRDANYKDGGWWTIEDVEGSLTDNGLTYNVLDLDTGDDITTVLDNDNIIICCLDMNLISQSDDVNSRFNLYYETYIDYGHFLIIKGHLNNKEWLIVNDPNSWIIDIPLIGVYQYYPDGNPMGKDRFYNTSEISNSILNWCSEFIEVTGVLNK